MNSGAGAGLRVAVVIPALDEARSIARVVAEIPAALVSEIVVVDNGSSDGTGDAARSAGARVVHEPRRGYGRACLTGIASLESDPPDVVVFLDADASDCPAEMPQLLSRIEAGGDLVIGSRVLGCAERGALAPQARYGNALVCFLLRVLYGARFTDLGPFRAIRYPALVALGMRDTNYGWTVEMQLRAVRAGLRCAEVPVSYRRRVGRSKITGTVRGTLLAGAKILWTVARHALSRGARGPLTLPPERAGARGAER